MTSKNITAISRVVTQEALEAVSQKLSNNIWAIPSRSAPNAEKLKDGAIQRMSVSPHRDNLYVKMNPDKIGFYKREELNERASKKDHLFSNWWDANQYRTKIARIY